MNKIINYQNEKIRGLFYFYIFNLTFLPKYDNEWVKN